LEVGGFSFPSQSAAQRPTTQAAAIIWFPVLGITCL